MCEVKIIVIKGGEVNWWKSQLFANHLASMLFRKVCDPCHALISESKLLLLTARERNLRKTQSTKEINDAPVYHQIEEYELHTFASPIAVGQGGINPCKKVNTMIPI